MPPPGVCLNILEARSKQSGHGSAKDPETFLQQDYEQLKQYCLIQGLRYIDERFPPDRSSIGEGILAPSELDRVVWLRPTVSSAALCLSRLSSWKNFLFLNFSLTGRCLSKKSYKIKVAVVFFFFFKLVGVSLIKEKAAPQSSLMSHHPTLLIINI